jgi:hypothetical protein
LVWHGCKTMVQLNVDHPLSSRDYMPGASTHPVRRLACALAMLLAASAAGYDSMYEQPPINYSQTSPTGPVARLQGQLDTGEVRLNRDSEQRFLRDLLTRLEVPVESQVLVFSKTSHQNPYITPKTPRAVYFGDDVYLGWVQGGVVEVADMSPTLGMTFYVLDHRDPAKPLKFERTASCLDCHASSRVNNCPACWCVRFIRTRTASRFSRRAAS